jgi:thiol:disulfide interchange protein
MKKTLSLLSLILAFSISTFAQIVTPVKWKFSSKKIADNEFQLIFTANIDKGWHVYSQFLESDNGPVATSFTFEKNNSYKLNGKTTESKSKKEYDASFEMNVNYFDTKADFFQKVVLLKEGKQTIKGSLQYMCCEEGRCLPPTDVEFSFELEGTAANNQDIKKMDDATVVLSQNNESDTGKIENKEELEQESSSTEIVKPLVEPTEEKKGSWGIFIAGFLGGLLALLTPCVFPMIPLTVSFFTKQSKNRRVGIINALIYSFSIIGIYVSLGLIITFSLGPDALNALASDGIMNMLFFIIFMVFAASFLGAFEITLPSSWVNKADQSSEKGGLLGIFFMAFTLSLVSFSCTGPIIGSLLVQAAVGGNVINPAIGMLGFSTALALPFGLFAAFPGWLNSLPKSGGWLNSVKVILGFLELALGLKFFSNVDLAYHWGIMTREVFIALWIVIFFLMGLYLLGKFKLSHDSDTKFVTVPRLLFSIVTFAFVVYLIPGMWGAPLKIISGFPPPTFYNEGWSLNSGGSAASKDEKAAKGTDADHCPHNLNCFHDYNLALSYSKEIGKPLLVDFTGWSCVNCRKMEDKVWVDPEVLKRLSQDYVLVSLYVDDKKELPENEKGVSKTTGNKIKTIGNKWSDLQTERYQTNTQPYYVLLDNKEELLNKPKGYDPSIENFIKFLDEGLNEYSKRKK